MARVRANHHVGHLWVEEGQAHEGLVAQVAPEIPTHRTYSFTVPPEMESHLSIGQRVAVPIGRRKRLVQGFVVGLDRKIWDSTLEPIDSLVDEAGFLTPDLIELGREIAVHYACPLGKTLKSLTPEAVRRQRGLKTVRSARLIVSAEEIRASGRRVSNKRSALIDALADSDGPMRVDALLTEAGASPAVLHGMVKAGWVEITSHKKPRDDPPVDCPALEEPTFSLNPDQLAALDQINARINEGRFSATLLAGVSGSGKTEVYIRAMRRVLAEGRQVILLVPEIVLTTQLVQRLASRFADVALMHSGLTQVQRSLMWRQTASGEKKVVIGTRSAVFAPCPDLGMICVDEEQESSYKNLQAPRFHVRDVALMRARQLDIPVVLGSATPAVETWYNSLHRSDYHRAVLPRRANDQPLPDVHLVDMRAEWMELRRMVVLSRAMENGLAETLERGEQAMLLVNRRGFADRLFCPKCKVNLTCPNCAVSLVTHRATGWSICHYCRNRVTTPTICPNLACGEKLVHLGLGTQRVEDAVAEQFPQARVQRVDSDTMTHRDRYLQIVSDFEARRVDVLVGTQMIAKGLDFPFVSFVGVVHADSSALSADFRAHERLFQLITQVAGRAGRAGTSGRVVVQTPTPELPALKYAMTHDYESFVTEELDTRKKAGFPPFRRLVRVVLSHPREETVEREAEALADRVQETIRTMGLDFADVLGPNPCALRRLKGRYRQDLLIRAVHASALRRLLSHLDEKNMLRLKAVTTMIDVDPVTLT